MRHQEAGRDGEPQVQGGTPPPRHSGDAPPVGELEEALTGPVEVRVVAPSFGSATELRQAADWVEAESRRLTSEAPTSVRKALAMRPDRGEVEDGQR